MHRSPVLVHSHLGFNFSVFYFRTIGPRPHYTYHSRGITRLLRAASAGRLPPLPHITTCPARGGATPPPSHAHNPAGGDFTNFVFTIFLLLVNFCYDCKPVQILGAIHTLCCVLLSGLSNVFKQCPICR